MPLQSDSYCPDCGEKLKYHQLTGLMWCPACGWAHDLDWSLWTLYQWA